MELSINRQKAMVKRRRRRHPLKWRALTFVVAVVLSLLPAMGMGLRTAQARSVDSVSVPLSAISLQEQPFYPSLEEISSSWTDIVLGQVVGESPKVTLLNFYAVMAKVGHRADSLGQQAKLSKGLFSSRQRREQIEDTNLLFNLAVKSLDSSHFPESIRSDMTDEAAIQLKHVLDYVFSHSHQPIIIPSIADLKLSDDDNSNPPASWRIPGTAIELTTVLDRDTNNENYYFSSNTVSSIHEMYDEIQHQPPIDQPYATPYFYKDFIFTPGYLIPPKWYLMLPAGIRRVIEIPIEGQTLFQISCAIIVFGFYLFVSLWLLGQLIATYRDSGSLQIPVSDWLQDNVAWTRVLIVLPVVLISSLTDQFIDNVINFTGLPLAFSTYFFYIVFYSSSSVFAFYFLEAIGRSGAELLTRLRGGHSTLQLQRISNLVMPLSRAVGLLVAVVLVYRLLLLLGLPASTVLAFSAVPGLAIGLGASKLLGNLFAGLSIQTDRPLRVGEFCQIGENLGFVTKIGLRSLELQTLESLIKIPNSVADEATIVNFSRRDSSPSPNPRQGVELRLQLPGHFSPFQLEELLCQSRLLIEDPERLDGLKAESYLVSLDNDSGDGKTLIVFVLVELHGWPAYLHMRETLLVQLEELLERIDLYEITIGVSYSTSSEQLVRVPDLLRSAVNADPYLHCVACRLLKISACSYDHEIEISSSHRMQNDFEDSIHRLHQRFIKVLGENNIEIPFPSQTLFVESLHSKA
jgi:MscS family membrane protein